MRSSAPDCGMSSSMTPMLSRLTKIFRGRDRRSRANRTRTARPAYRLAQGTGTAEGAADGREHGRSGIAVGRSSATLHATVDGRVGERGPLATSARPARVPAFGPAVASVADFGGALSGA